MSEPPGNGGGSTGIINPPSPDTISASTATLSAPREPDKLSSAEQERLTAALDREEISALALQTDDKAAQARSEGICAQQITEKEQR